MTTCACGRAATTAMDTSTGELVTDKCVRCCNAENARAAAAVVPFPGDAGCTWCAGDDNVRQTLDGLRLCGTCRRNRKKAGGT